MCVEGVVTVRYLGGCRDLLCFVFCVSRCSRSKSKEGVFGYGVCEHVPLGSGGAPIIVVIKYVILRQEKV